MIIKSKNGQYNGIARTTRSERLKHLLEVNERPVSWLAGKLGVSPTTVHNWIKGKRKIKLKWISLINHIFSVDSRYWENAE